MGTLIRRGVSTKLHLPSGDVGPSVTPQRGDTFTHARAAEPEWRPEPGQTYNEHAPLAQMTITAVRNGWVYYGYSVYGRGGFKSRIGQFYEEVSVG